MTPSPHLHLDAFELLDALPLGVVVHGPDTRILHVNSRGLEVLRLTEAQALGKEALDFQWQLVDTFLHPLPLDQFPVNRVLATGQPVQGLQLGVTDSSSQGVTWLTVNAVPQRDGAGHITRVVVSFTENVHARADIPFKDIVDTARDVIIITEAWPLQEPGPRITYVNDAFTQLTGFSARDVIGKNPRILQRADADPAVRARIGAALRQGNACRETIYNYSKQGEGYWLEMHIVPLKNARGEVTYFAAIERDVTEQVERQQELNHFAYHDALTQLPNRRMLLDRLAQALLAARRARGHLAVVFIDLNQFKQLNDVHGHDAGDLLLVAVAKRLKDCVRETDTVARLGGDEFVILLGQLDPDAGAARQAVSLVLDKVRLALARDYLLGDLPYRGSASVGARVVLGGDHDLDQLLKDADAAMYAEKHRVAR